MQRARRRGISWTPPKPVAALIDVPKTVVRLSRLVQCRIRRRRQQSALTVAGAVAVAVARVLAVEQMVSVAPATVAMILIELLVGHENDDVAGTHSSKKDRISPAGNDEL